MDRLAYLDNAATTMLYPELIDTIAKYSCTLYGNPSSLHGMGMAAEDALNLSRRLIADIIGAEPRQVVFTSGASEANALILGNSSFDLNGERPLNNMVLTSSCEHSSVLETVKALYPHNYHLLNTDKNGSLLISDLSKALSTKTRLLSLIYVNNELGTILDIDAIKKQLEDSSFSGIFHVDATQALGKLDIDVKKLGVDALSASAHKFHGPKGVGFLYVKDPDKLRALIHGGGQESGKRAGTENVAYICAMAKALAKANSKKEQAYGETSLLKKRVLDYVNTNSNISPTVGYEELGNSASPYIISLSCKGYPAEVLVHMYEKQGVYVSSGSACSSNKDTVSHVLKAIGRGAEHGWSVIRLSFSQMSSQEDVSAFITASERIFS